jgi:hypothetical protein
MSPQTKAIVDNMRDRLKQLDAERERLAAAIKVIDPPRMGRPPKDRA